MINNEHIIIGGTGRAGSTALMTLISLIDERLTGFDSTDLEKVKSSIGNAGLELSIDKIIKGDNLPLVIKNPAIHAFLEKLISNKKIKLSRIVIPIRDLDDAKNSRVNVSRKYLSSLRFTKKIKALILYFYYIYIKNDPNWSLGDGGINFRYPSTSTNINASLLYNVYSLCYVASKNSIPITFIAFPQFVRDKDYCKRQLSEIFNFEIEKFDQAFDRMKIYKG